LAGDPPDVLLRPTLPGYTWLDFHRAKEAIAAGWECAEAARPILTEACQIKQTGG